MPRRESESDSDEPLSLQEKKRKKIQKPKMQFAWLPTMAQEFASNLWPVIEEHLPPDITVERLAEYMLPDVGNLLNYFLTLLIYSSYSKYSSNCFQGWPEKALKK